MMVKTETLLRMQRRRDRLGTLGQSLGWKCDFVEGRFSGSKTTLVQGIGEGLGITEPIVSPTFTLINEYRGTLASATWFAA